MAEVIQLDKLKAALQIAETQARDIPSAFRHRSIRIMASFRATLHELIPSVVNGTRTVDVQLDGALPPGAVPNLSVDGTIDLEKLHDVLYVGRPALGNENSTLSLFKEIARSQGRCTRSGEGWTRFG